MGAVTTVEDPPACAVSLLVPHPTRPAVLFQASSGPSAVRSLPLVSTRIEPSIVDILEAATPLLGGEVVPLRMIALETTNHHEATSVLVETEPFAASAPPGYEWRDLDADSLGLLQPIAARVVVGGYVDERDNGWSAQRPQFSRPGWFRRASDWMVREMVAAGQIVHTAPRPHYLWDVSAVLRAGSDSGDVYLKCSSDVFRHEAAVTYALSSHLPQLVTEVLSIDAAEGWMLMKNLGALELGDQDQSLWGLGLEALAAIQQSWLAKPPDTATMNLPVRALVTLALETEALCDDDDLMASLEEDLRAEWRTTVPALVDACLRLDEIGPWPTIVHGDFHPWNVVYGPKGVRVFDWTDAALSHPFVDVATYVHRAETASIRRELLETYLAAWRGQLPPDLLSEAGDLALVVGALYQVQTYRTILPTLSPGNQLAGADIDWMRRSIARLHHGLDAPR